MRKEMSLERTARAKIVETTDCGRQQRGKNVATAFGVNTNLRESVCHNFSLGERSY